MANKINLSSTLSLSATHARPSMSFTIAVDQVGTNFVEETQTISNVSAVALDIGSIGTLGYLVVQNLDAANAVTLATDSNMTNQIAHIAAGAGVLIPPPAGATIYLRAANAPVQISFLAIEL